MSKSLNLVKYKADESGKLYESECETIDSVFISSDLISELEKDFPLVNISVFEDGDLDDNYEIECFPVEQSIELHSRLEELFIEVLKHEAEVYLESDSLSSSKDLGFIKKTDVSLSVDRFRTITNVIYLVRLKINKYLEQSSVVLKLG